MMTTVSLLHRLPAPVFILCFLLFPSTQASGQESTLAVVDLEGHGISESESVSLTNRLRNEIFRLGDYSVVERGIMQAILKEQDFQLSGCTSNECLVEVGQLLGAKLIAGGSVGKVGQIYSVSVRIIDVETGELMHVVDWDVLGGLEEVLINGMREVAALLSESQRSLSPDDRNAASMTETERSRRSTDVSPQGNKQSAQTQAFSNQYWNKLEIGLGYYDDWQQSTVETRNVSHLELKYYIVRSIQHSGPGLSYSIRPMVVGGLYSSMYQNRSPDITKINESDDEIAIAGISLAGGMQYRLIFGSVQFSMSGSAGLIFASYAWSFRTNETPGLIPILHLGAALYLLDGFVFAEVRLNLDTYTRVVLPEFGFGIRAIKGSQ